MSWARSHARLLSVLAFCLLALVAELVGRALTAWIDVGRHIGTPSGSAAADYYPFLLVGVKLSVALLLARLAWRVARARRCERSAVRMLRRAGVPIATAPKPSVRLSPRLWLAFFAVTSFIYLVQTEAESAVAGRWALLAPWLHTSALPVFAVLAVGLALVWRVVQRWLAAYERFAAAVAERARRIVTAGASALTPEYVAVLAPRRLHGLAFESRPPPFPV